jgi:hypothetical protein
MLLCHFFVITGNVYRALFYEKYNAMFSSKIGKTNELNEEKYNHIVHVKLNYKTVTAKQRTKCMHNFFNRYELGGNVRNCSLVCKQKGKFLPCAVVERLFEIINDIRVNKLGHARSEKKNFTAVQQKWYGIPRTAVEMYLSLCPHCTINSKKTKKTKLCPLKFMISSSCGARAQVDLIDMRSSEDPVTGHKWILCYGDHLSGYSQVWCLTIKFQRRMVRLWFQYCHPLYYQRYCSLIMEENSWVSKY